MPCHINGFIIHKIVVLSLLQVQDPEGQADDLGPVADQNEEGVAGQLQEGGAVQVAAAAPPMPQLTQVCA